MTIISLDPGGTTGVCLYVEGKLTVDQLGPEKHHEGLWETLTAHNPDIVVCEDFLYRQQSKANLVSVEYIGITRLWCSVNGARLVMQTPAIGKGFWVDVKIKTVGEWQKGAPHSMDALRHMLQFLTFSQGNNTYIDKLKSLH